MTPTDTSEDTPTLGKCCGCGCAGPTVRTVLMVDLRAPDPDKGWNCMVCGLRGGAIAVLCDDCASKPTPPLLYVCEGNPSENKRVLMSSLDQTPFTHNAELHAAEEQLYGIDDDEQYGIPV